LQTPNSDKDW